ncbi:MAG: alkaline phosphatase [Odoribacter sp.]|nr:alkaline phosphatase [Odoribacter sp.]
MKNKLLIIISLSIIIIVSGGSGHSSGKPQKAAAKPLNIILFIGDGMGPAQLTAGITVSDRKLVIEDFPYSGLCKTSSSDKYVTDSGAAGTAIACGTKTKNGMIGMGPDSISVKSIMEIAHANGLATGLVSTSSITHATPASFVAHNAGRGNYEDIAKDFMNGTIDVFIGGGIDHFRNRKDGVDLTVKLKEQGYDVVYTIDDLQKSNSGKIAGLLAKEHMEKSTEGRMGKLAIMTEKAIQVLSKNKKGFVLMVEGSQIDWAGHDRDIDWVVSEVIDMDAAVEKAYKFARESRNTLVVVTADHETGGLTLPGGSLNDHKVVGKFGDGVHTAVIVPVLSFGPGAERFSGIYENTFFFNEFIDLLKLKR